MEESNTTSLTETLGRLKAHGAQGAHFNGTRPREMPFELQYTAVVMREIEAFE